MGEHFIYVGFNLRRYLYPKQFVYKSNTTMSDELLEMRNGTVMSQSGFNPAFL